MCSALLSLSLFIGCGGSGKAERVDVTGSVTFKGAPVPQGRIDFYPTQQGPAAYAMIANGRFDTSKDGKGAVVGQHRVKIHGFDGAPLGEEGGDFGNALFPAYETTAEIQQGENSIDFIVSETK